MWPPAWSSKTSIFHADLIEYHKRFFRAWCGNQPSSERLLYSKLFEMFNIHSPRRPPGHLTLVKFPKSLKIVVKMPHLRVIPGDQTLIWQKQTLILQNINELGILQLHKIGETCNIDLWSSNCIHCEKMRDGKEKNIHHLTPTLNLDCAREGFTYHGYIICTSG